MNNNQSKIVNIQKFEQLKKEKKLMYLEIAGNAIIETLGAIFKIAGAIAYADPGFKEEGTYNSTISSYDKLKRIKSELSQLGNNLSNSNGLERSR